MHSDEAVPMKGEWRIPSNAVIRTPTVLLFDQVLEEGGILSALKFLNARAGYRFTCVNRFDRASIRNVFFFDRENYARQHPPPTQLIAEAYASLVHRFRKPFSTTNAQEDARLTRIEARNTVLAYLGVPMWLSSGTLWGVLSHQDCVAHVPPKGEEELLTELAPVIGWRLRAQASAEQDVPLSPPDGSHFENRLKM
jgi:GAF domain-containing protein